MGKDIIGPLKAALFAAIIVGLTSYLAENYDPVIAGLLMSLPVALPSLWFLEDNFSLKDYTWAFLLGMIIYCLIVILFYYLISRAGYEKKKGLIISMMVWFLVVIIIYYTILKKDIKS